MTDLTRLPQAAQDALRIETMTTALSLKAFLDNRRPSSAASLMALIGVFVEMHSKTAAAGNPVEAFQRGLAAYCTPFFDAKPGEMAKVNEYLRDPDILPPNTADVILSLRAEAVRAATPVHEEKA